MKADGSAKRLHVKTFNRQRDGAAFAAAAFKLRAAALKDSLSKMQALAVLSLRIRAQSRLDFELLEHAQMFGVLCLEQKLYASSCN